MPRRRKELRNSSNYNLVSLRLSGQKQKPIHKKFLFNNNLNFYENEKVNNYHDEPLLVGR